MSQIDTWNVFISLIPFEKVWVATLKADIEILKLISMGYSAHYISNALGIKSQSVYKAARTWGMFVPQVTLDFNPLLVYNDGMTAEDMYAKVYPITTLDNLSLEDYRNIIYNVERYLILLEELENEN